MTSVSLGCRLFNDGQYFEAHEAWEQVWKTYLKEGQTSFAKEMQAAILLCGVLVLLEKGRARGAAALLHRLFQGDLGWTRDGILQWSQPDRLIQELNAGMKELAPFQGQASPEGRHDELLQRLSSFRVALRE